MSNWVLRASEDWLKPIVPYEYTPDKKAENARQFLAEFSGYLHTDGNKSYWILSEDISVVGCMAHARRKFITALDALPKGKQKNSSAYKGLSFIGRLYEIEESIREKTSEERYTTRQEQSKPVFEALSAWAKTMHTSSKSSLGDALSYLTDNKPYLRRYLEDGRLGIDNNRAE